MKDMIFIILAVILISCNSQETATTGELAIDSMHRSSPAIEPAAAESTMISVKDSIQIKTKNITPREVVEFATTLIGVPYKYASTDPMQGFDCSGFITFVFNHFNIEVPRSSIDFTNVGIAVEKEFSKPGDLILFTGTDTLETFVGHMGIVTENTDSLRFIHSTSGKKYGVTITSLNEYYLKRFVKVVRVFPGEA